MSSRSAFNARKSRNFSRRVISGRGKRRVRNNNNAFRRARPRHVVRYKMAFNNKPVQNFKVYVGTLTGAGMKIDIGPSSDYANTSYFMTSRNFNNYVPIAVSLEYNPLLNQTTATSNINAYLTNDVATDLPASDTDMKNSTINHRGVEWFAAYRKNHKFHIPTLKQNTYETGSGDIKTNAPYEPAAFIMVKPTSLADPKTNVGELYINVTVRFSSPAMPTPTSTTSLIEKIELDKSITSVPDLTRAFFLGLSNLTTATYMALNHDGEVNVSTFYKCVNDSKAWSKVSGTGDKFIISEKPKEKFPNAKIMEWKNTGSDDAPNYQWVEQAESTVNAYIVNNIVPSYSSTVENGLGKYTLNATPIPIYNTENERSQLYRTLLLNNVVPSKNYSYKLHPDDEEEITLTADSIPIHCKNVEDVDDMPVDVMRQPIDVTVKNESIPVEILDQPISVKEEKDAADDILGLLESGLAIL